MQAILTQLHGTRYTEREKAPKLSLHGKHLYNRTRHYGIAYLETFAKKKTPPDKHARSMYLPSLLKKKRKDRHMLHDNMYYNTRLPRRNNATFPRHAPWTQAAEAAEQISAAQTQHLQQQRLQLYHRH